MDFYIKLLIFVIICVIKVDSVIIKGPMSTKYVPCGLGAIHFDKISPGHWEAVINFGLYSNLLEAEMDIYFEKKVNIYELSHNTSFEVRSNTFYDFRIKTIGPIPKKYTFKVAVQDIYVNDLPVVKSFAINNVILCNKEIQAAHTINSFNVMTNIPERPYTHLCGRRAIENTEVTFVGADARPGDWPWHVALMTKEINYKCGGTIISMTAVLTPSYCTFISDLKLNPENITVIAGVTNFKYLLNDSAIQTRLAQKIIRHPDTMDQNYFVHLTIIKVSPFKFTNFVQPICLWAPINDKSNLIGKQGVTVGFGNNENGTSSKTLRSTYTTVHNDGPCQSVNSNGNYTFCSSKEPTTGNIPTTGDGGGGYVVESVQPDNKISWYLRGVFTVCGAKEGTCDPNSYISYTDVGTHYHWIYNTLKSAPSDLDPSLVMSGAFME
ncbi:hypothetical protein K1T71_005472 [Dendrolimus kikuchii]|uniref:Uncharacterized protein n=1 Tax=Dendrolimus kikuchii TaxID=765133 RepID=A0ACC1D4B0_9NEOP|nr:hypothetical protein K1T71_005472 [Dendrolimus kikuchii]